MSRLFENADPSRYVIAKSDRYWRAYCPLHRQWLATDTFTDALDFVTKHLRGDSRCFRWPAVLR